MTRPRVLQLVKMLPAIQAELDAHYAVVRLPPVEEAPWLAAEGPAIRAVVTNGQAGIDDRLLDALPALEIVAISGVGYDRVDLERAHARGIRVTNTPDVLTDDVADLAIALMLNAMRKLHAAERHVREGHWPHHGLPLARRASGLRYGIVGLGRIGTAIARRLGGFGGRIAYTGPRPKEVAHDYHADIVALARESDVLFVATPGSAATRHLIDRAVIEALGPTGVLVNISRGSVVDEDALVEALVAGRLGGAGLDVFAQEPHVPAALRALDQVALAPHVGSATGETRHAMGRLMLDNLTAHFAGRKLLTPVV